MKFIELVVTLLFMLTVYLLNVVVFSVIFPLLKLGREITGSAYTSFVIIELSVIISVLIPSLIFSALTKTRWYFPSMGVVLLYIHYLIKSGISPNQTIIIVINLVSLGISVFLIYLVFTKTRLFLRKRTGKNN